MKLKEIRKLTYDELPPEYKRQVDARCCSSYYKKNDKLKSKNNKMKILKYIRKSVLLFIGLLIGLFIGSLIKGYFFLN